MYSFSVCRREREKIAFQDIGLKPKLLAVRLAIYILLYTATYFHGDQLFAKPGKVQEKFSKVFVRPDRSKVEHAREKS